MTPRQHSTPNDGAWKVDRHIPIALIFTVFVQGAVVIWWGSALDQRVGSTETINARQDEQIKATEAALAAQEVAFATAAAELRGVRDSLSEVKDTLAEQNRLLREILTNERAKP